MSIITLTSDLGSRDPYVPSVKGYILGRKADARLVDISHEISSFNVAEASYILKNCYKEFPSDTIHLISIDSNYEPLRFIGVRTALGTFFAHDNGIISLILDQGTAMEIISLPYAKEDAIFPLKRIFAQAAVKLLSGEDFSSLGEKMDHINQLANFLPMQEDNILRGNVIHIDVFGNAITNIHQFMFERFGNGRKPTIYVTPRERVTRINTDYSVKKDDGGAILCLFNSNGYLEVAIHKGRASNLLGMRLGATIMIEFE